MIMSSTSPTIIRTMSDINNLQKNKSILIAGFPGPGLVGSISTSYIIDKLNMHQIACVESEYISPGVIYLDGIPVQGIPRPDRRPIILGSTEMDENVIDSNENNNNKNEEKDISLSKT